MRKKTKTKMVKCAGGCHTEMARVDEHAVGWRPMCESCFKANKSGLFNYGRTSNDSVHAVRERIRED